MASSTKLRHSSSFLNLILSCLNFILFILSSASIAPIILLRTPPTSLGWALLISSIISISSSILGFYSHLTHLCFMTHISFLLASLGSQVLSFLALWTKEKRSMSMLDSKRDPREVMVLVRLECGILFGVLVLQLLVLVLSCVVQSCWVKKFEGLEEEKERTARKRSRRIAEIREESMSNLAKGSEIKAREFDEKMKSKYGTGHWDKNDLERMSI